MDLTGHQKKKKNDKDTFIFLSSSYPVIPGMQ